MNEIRKNGSQGDAWRAIYTTPLFPQSGESLQKKESLVKKPVEKQRKKTPVVAQIHWKQDSHHLRFQKRQKERIKNRTMTKKEWKAYNREERSITRPERIKRTRMGLRELTSRLKATLPTITEVRNLRKAVNETDGIFAQIKKAAGEVKQDKQASAFNRAEAKAYAENSRINADSSGRSALKAGQEANRSEEARDESRRYADISNIRADSASQSETNSAMHEASAANLAKSAADSAQQAKNSADKAALSAANAKVSQEKSGRNRWFVLLGVAGVIGLLGLLGQCETEERPGLAAPTTSAATGTPRPPEATAVVPIVAQTATFAPTATEKPKPTATATSRPPTEIPTPTVTPAKEVLPTPVFGVKYDETTGRCDVVDKNTGKAIDISNTPPVANRQLPQLTGVGVTKDITTILQPGQTAIIQGSTVDDESDGVFKVVTAKTNETLVFTSRIGDGAVNVVDQKDGPLAFCIAVRSSVDQKFAHSKVHVPEEWKSN